MMPSSSSNKVANSLIEQHAPQLSYLPNVVFVFTIIPYSLTVELL